MYLEKQFFAKAGILMISGSIFDDLGVALGFILLTSDVLATGAKFDDCSAPPWGNPRSWKLSRVVKG